MQQGYFGWWLLECLGMIAADRSEEDVYFTGGNREDDVDYFGRLPDDIIIDIFVRVNDCKFLTQCLLLSKRIASLIRLVSSVFINIHLTHVEDNYPREYCFNSLGFLRFKLIRATYNNLTQDIQFQSWWKFRIDTNSFFIRKARQLLHPFSEVKSAIVEYPSKFDFFSFWVSNTVRWMVEYSGGPVNTGIIKSCAFQGPIMTFNGPIMTILDSRNIMALISWFISDLLEFASTFYPMVVQMVQDHESLRDILVISRKGWIHAREDEIVKMRQSSAGVFCTEKLMNTIREEGMNITMKVKVWYDVRVLNPPRERSSTVNAFVVVSSSDNIDHEVKTATSRFWGNCNYWKGHRDDETINMRKLVETRPCNLEFTWIASYIGNNLP